MGHPLKREESKMENPFIIFLQPIEKSILQSLKKLQTDYVDIVLLHSNGKDEEKILEDGYRFEIDKTEGDFGHIFPVKFIKPFGRP